MAPKILFVHGTGVREPAYTSTLELIRERVKQKRPDIAVEPCNWGKEHGAELNAGRASIPTADKNRAIPGAAGESQEDMALTLWELLYEDPLFEIRLLLQSAAKAPLFGNENTASAKVLQRLNSVQSEAEAEPVRKAAGDAETVASLTAAAQWLAKQNEVRDLLSRAKDTKDFATTAARAVVARVIAEATEKGEFSPLILEADRRDSTVNALAGWLGGTDRSILGSLVGAVTKPLAGLALRPVSRMGVWWRGGMMEKVSPVAGDILLYQARGEGIQKFIRQRIQEVGGPVVLFAHSLGGVACVDMLIKQAEPAVKLLVTVGSQAPFFYEINALQTLPFENAPAMKRLPSHFPEWLNAYDPRDFLSFVGEGIFGGCVKDVRVNNRQPFPQSHSAYWGNRQVWDAIFPCLPAQ